jgi:hypothetical protein
MSGTLLMSLFKIFRSCFPFLRELFLGDPRGRSKGKRKNPALEALKKILIAIGLVCSLMCAFLAYRLWCVSVDYHKLTREMTASAPAAIRPQAAPSQVPMPDPTPLIDKNPPGAGKSARKKHYAAQQNRDDDQLSRLDEINRSTR